VVGLNLRYIGGKSQLLDIIYDNINDIAPNAKTIIDLFSGSGVVANHFKSLNYNVICNDQMYFSYVLLRGITQLNNEPTFEKLHVKNPIEYLNSLEFKSTDFQLENCFIYQNYSPHDTCDRMYFSTENALKIDIIRLTIESWKTDNKITEDEYYYLLASLVSAVPYVSNIAGVYGAYLKHWDSRALKPLKLIPPTIQISDKKVETFNEDYLDVLEKTQADILYSDSPYNTREYLPNYHILETIAKYDYPEVKGVTGLRDYSNQKSDFCSKTTVKEAFEQMIRKANVKYIIISYNNEGLINTEELADLCKKYAIEGTFKLIEIPYRRYKSKVPNNKTGLVEQLYCFEKRKNVFVKSPFNYIGGKYKLLPQIEKLFPKHINKMVDLFCGGCDVSVNTIAKEIYANDVNNFVIDILKTMQKYDIDTLIKEIDDKITKYNLSKTNNEAYIAFREHYNKTRNPIDLYILICFSFNYQFRFNSKLEYNNPFGKNRSCFNDSIRKNLINFHKQIKHINFSNKNFKEFDINFLGKKDFIYADPPYLISTATYNDGKRGFDGWTKEDDKKLFELLDNANKKGIKFALSNVIEHKGIKNTELIEWASKYNIHYLNFNYNNSNYQNNNKEHQTIEVLITNY
jgi:adenine-specific DNA-methyltransferase